MDCSDKNICNSRTQAQHLDSAGYLILLYLIMSVSSQNTLSVIGLIITVLKRVIACSTYLQFREQREGGDLEFEERLLLVHPCHQAAHLLQAALQFLHLL